MSSVRPSLSLSLYREACGHLTRPPAALQTHDRASPFQHEAIAARVGDVVVDRIIELDGTHGARDDGARVGTGQHTCGEIDRYIDS